MNESILIETLDNAWRALADSYTQCPDETIRSATNIITSVIAETKRRLFQIKETERRERESVSLDEWREWLIQSDTVKGA